MSHELVMALQLSTRLTGAGLILELASKDFFLFSCLLLCTVLEEAAYPKHV